MKYEDIKGELKRGKKIFDLPLRVTFYCRVSTDSDEQLNSLENQVSYYEDYIKRYSNWTFVNGYIEKGVSGVSVKKRKEFLRMVKDASLGKFDLIIIKETARFARDIVDGPQYLRKFEDYGVGLYFETQGLCSMEESSTMVLNFMFSLAQEESNRISQRVKFGHEQAIKNGRVLGSGNITGYTKDNGKLVIVEKEAKFIRTLFELYASGEYGYYKLSSKLAELGYLNKKGKLYDKASLQRMIKNPKYKGFYRAHEHEIKDYRTKKRITNDLSKQTIYKCDTDSVPAIVSEELWDQANSIYKTRSESYDSNNNWSGGLKYAFSSKIYCAEHNANFQRSHGSRRKKRPTWACGYYLQHRLAACSSPIIAEIDLNNIMNDVMREVIPNKNNIVNDMLALYENIAVISEYDKDLELLDKEIDSVENKKSEAISLVVEGILRKSDLKVQFERYEEELNTLHNDRNKILKEIEVMQTNRTNIDIISKSIQEEIDGGSLDEFVRKFVQDIIVSKVDNDRYNIKLDIYLNLFGTEKAKVKGSSRFTGSLDGDVPFIQNKTCETIEVKRITDIPNKFTYNVFIETL